MINMHCHAKGKEPWVVSFFKALRFSFIRSISVFTGLRQPFDQKFEHVCILGFYFQIRYSEDTPSHHFFVFPIVGSLFG